MLSYQIKELAVQFLRKAEYLIRKLNNSIGSEGGWLGWSLLDFMRLMLISTQVEVLVEVGVELGNSFLCQIANQNLNGKKIH